VRNCLCLLALCLAATAASLAHAAGGYYTGTKGARASGRAGAFTVKADDLSAVALNPAGLSRLDTTLIHGGNRFSYNAHVFTRAPTLDWGNLEGGVPPYVEFAPARNQRPWQLLDPLLGVASNLGLKDWGFALAAYAPAGIAEQEYPVDGGQRYMMVSREVMMLNYTASAAWKYRELFGVGATLQWIHVPRLTYALVIDAAPFPGDAHPVSSELDMHATVTGSDPFTFNAILGTWYRPAPFLELAVSGQVIPAQIRTNSTLAIEPLNRQIVDQVELTRNGERANDVTVSLPLPLTARVGVRYRHLQDQREVFDVELNLGYESWSRVERFSLDTDGLTASLLEQDVDVGVIEIEKQWRDTVSVQLGGDYAVVTRWLTLRSGLFYDSAVADRRYAHVDFASGQQLGAALGASVFVRDLEVALAYEYRHQPTVRVSEREARVYQEVPGSSCQPPFTDPDTCHEQYLGQPAPAVNAGSYRAHSHIASLDLLYRF
jgi:long-subunit fatty acid transport protein